VPFAIITACVFLTPTAGGYKLSNRSCRFGYSNPIRLRVSSGL